ncbi:hypothetical protein C8R42DRAFT_643511 [Lentinula raphanica]|nr:hypothetical protein C8R42DRAFT_643511 [Lentinula raphanica]
MCALECALHVPLSVQTARQRAILFLSNNQMKSGGYKEEGIGITCVQTERQRAILFLSDNQMKSGGYKEEGMGITWVRIELLKIVVTTQRGLRKWLRGVGMPVTTCHI